MSDRGNASGEVVPRRERLCSVSVLTLIAVTSIISTTVSLLVGLFLYQETIATLKESISIVSSAELSRLELEILGIFKRPMKVVDIMESHFFHTRMMRGSTSRYQSDDGKTLIRVSPNDSLQWLNRFEAVSIGHIEPEYPAGVFDVVLSLFPFKKKDPAYLNWHVWWDDTIYESGEPILFSGGYSPDMVNISYNASSDDALPLALTWNITRMGERLHYQYNWSLEYYWYLKEEDDIDDPLFTPKGWKRINNTAPASRMFYRWRPPVTFARRIYTAYEVLFRPPPPPHPWSSYKAVLLGGMFVFAYWVPIVEKYSEENPTKKVVVVDPTRDWVHAASGVPRHTCPPVRRLQGASACRLRMANMTADIADCYFAAAKNWKGSEIFLEAACDGMPHFIRLRMAVQHIPDDGDLESRLEAALLWIQKTSFVKARVDEALILFISFIFIVLLVDVLLGILEFRLVVMPMWGLAAGLKGVSHLSVDCHTLPRLNRGWIRIREVGYVLNGAIVMMKCLEQLKGFIPSLLFEPECGCSESESALRTVGSATVRSTTICSELESTECMVLRLVPQHVTLVLVNVIGFLQLTSKDVMLGKHTDFVEAMTLITNRHKGEAVSFTGDRMLSAWNIPCSLNSGCRFSSSALDWFEGFGMKPSISVCSGEVGYGTLGIPALKRLSFLGPLASWSYTLERLNKVYDTQILISGQVEQVTEFVLQLIDSVSYPKMDAPLFIYELLCSEMSSDDSLSVSAFNQAFASYLQDNNQRFLGLKGELEEKLENQIAKHGLGTRAVAIL